MFLILTPLIRWKSNMFLILTPLIKELKRITKMHKISVMQPDKFAIFKLGL